MTQQSDDASRSGEEVPSTDLATETESPPLALQVHDPKDMLLRQVLQHALNVLVAFRIRATGRRIYFLKDMSADDLETAVSVAELTKLAIEHDCEGSSLLTKPPEEVLVEFAIRNEMDEVIGQRGGIF
jgi:hypothetical protein